MVTCDRNAFSRSSCRVHVVWLRGSVRAPWGVRVNGGGGTVLCEGGDWGLVANWCARSMEAVWAGVGIYTYVDLVMKRSTIPRATWNSLGFSLITLQP